MSVQIDPVDDFLGSYAGAVRGRDLAGFMRLYAEDVVVFDAWDRMEYRGRDAWAGMIRRWFESLGDESVEVRFDEVRVTSGDDVAFVSALVTYAGISAEGKTLRSMVNRMSVGLRRTGQRWEVVHEHTSLPVDSESGKMVSGA